MLESPAWRALPDGAKAVIERIEIEHMYHGGTENGRLPVTYADFEQHGARRKSIKFYLMVAEALGFIDCTEAGNAGAGHTRRAARYALTWIDRYDGAPRSNRWRTVETLADARRVADVVKAKLKPETAQHRPAALKAVA
jgi:hypothetical protein